jgi:signal transduction histidine kinase
MDYKYIRESKKGLYNRLIFCHSAASNIGNGFTLPRILLVDDEELELTITKRKLEQESPKFDITPVNSAQKALEKLKEAQFDIVISDYLMPEVNGLELLQKLRNASNGIPFIMLTGKGREEVAMQALNLGADYYIIKGGDPKLLFAELGHVIRKVLKHRRIEEELLKTREELESKVETRTTELRTANEALKRQKEELSEFANVMAHDLQNFLVTIKGYADLLQIRYDEAHIQKIQQITNDMNALLGRSVALADAGLVIEKTGKEDMKSLAQGVAEVTIPPGIAFDIDELPTVICDREKVIQIFKNIFENAIVHGSPNKIQISQQSSDNGVDILIANNGAKISSGARSKIFERGFSTREGGTGLGLAIVQKLCQAHGWNVSLGEKSGTIFCVSIPNDSIVTMT